MSDEVIQQDGEVEVGAESAAEAPVEHHGAPIESRFLYVDVSALRAKQLRRGAKVRLPEPTEESGPRPNKPERLAMDEVRQGLVEWELPEFKVIFDNR
ncbi:MAG: DNA-directed RNA polymerase subunit omega [Vicinamibacterales bacterium]